MNKIFYCSGCDKFTLKRECCGSKTESSRPGKFSLKDKYSKWRRIGRKEDLGEG